MQLPRPRGPLSERVFAELAAPTPRAVPVELSDPVIDVLADEDVQVTLWALYELSFRGFDDVAPDHEWSPGLLTTRAELEGVFETALRDLTSDAVDRACEEHARTADQVLAVIDDVDDPRLPPGPPPRGARGEDHRVLGRPRHPH